MHVLFHGPRSLEFCIRVYHYIFYSSYMYFTKRVFHIWYDVILCINITGKVLRVTGEYCYITLKYTVFVGHIII